MDFVQPIDSSTRLLAYTRTCITEDPPNDIHKNDCGNSESDFLSVVYINHRQHWMLLPALLNLFFIVSLRCFAFPDLSFLGDNYAPLKSFKVTVVGTWDSITQGYSDTALHRRASNDIPTIHRDTLTQLDSILTKLGNLNKASTKDRIGVTKSLQAAGYPPNIPIPRTAQFEWNRLVASYIRYILSLREEKRISDTEAMKEIETFFNDALRSWNLRSSTGALPPFGDRKNRMIPDSSRRQIHFYRSLFENRRFRTGRVSMDVDLIKKKGRKATEEEKRNARSGVDEVQVWDVYDLIRHLGSERGERELDARGFMDHLEGLEVDWDEGVLGALEVAGRKT